MPGGESLQQVFERAWQALGRALDSLEDDATVLAGESVAVVSDPGNQVLALVGVSADAGDIEPAARPDAGAFAGGTSERLYAPLAIVRRSDASGIVSVSVPTATCVRPAAHTVERDGHG